MRFGPYEIRDVQQIESVLKELSINYSVEVDRDALKKGEKEYHGKYQHFNPGFKYHVRSTYINIDDTNFKNIGTSLIEFGIIHPEIQEFLEEGPPVNFFDSDKMRQRKPIRTTLRLLIFIFFLLLVIFFLMYSWF